MLTLAISSSGIPVYMIEDVSRNGVVDLEDAIMQVQDLTQSTSTTGGFEYNFENLLNFPSPFFDKDNHRRFNLAKIIYRVRRQMSCLP